MIPLIKHTFTHPITHSETVALAMRHWPMPCMIEIKDLLDLCAALVYAAKCEWRMACYWAAAATLTACVTYTGGAK